MARSNVSAALTHVLAQEGGYVDHPADPGGATNKGITIQTLAQWRGHAVTKDDVRNLSIKEAGEMYHARYWQAVHADDLPAGLDLAMFDYAVNSGPARAIKTLQQALGLTPDGRWTAQMFLMFRLWRPDVLPVLDLGVRKGAQRIYNMRALPDAARLEKVAKTWRPWASIASWYCWRTLDADDAGGW